MNNYAQLFLKYNNFKTQEEFMYALRNLKWYEELINNSPKEDSLTYWFIFTGYKIYESKLS